MKRVNILLVITVISFLFLPGCLNFVDTDKLIHDKNITILKVTGFSYSGKHKRFDSYYFNDKDTIKFDVSLGVINNKINIGDEYYILYERNGPDYNFIEDTLGCMIPVNSYWSEILKSNSYRMENHRNRVVIYPNK